MFKKIKEFFFPPEKQEATIQKATFQKNGKLYIPVQSEEDAQMIICRMAMQSGQVMSGKLQEIDNQLYIIKDL